MHSILQTLPGKTLSILLALALVVLPLNTPSAQTTTQPILSNMRVTPNRVRPFLEDISVQFDLKTNASIRLEVVRHESGEILFSDTRWSTPGTNAIPWRLHDDSRIAVSPGRYRFRLIHGANNALLAEELRDLYLIAPQGNNLNTTSVFLPGPPFKPEYVTKKHVSRGGVAATILGLGLFGAGAYAYERALADGDFYIPDSNSGEEMPDAEAATVLSWAFGALFVFFGIVAIARSKTVQVQSRDNAAFNARTEQQYQAKLREETEKIERENTRIKESTLLELRPLLTGPLKLTPQIAFQEPSGNRILDAEEEGALLVDVRNDGPGKAYDVTVDLAPASLSNLVYRASHRLNDIDPGTTARLRIPLLADKGIPSGEITLSVQIREYNGFDANPIRLTIPARAFLAPNFVLREFGIKDQSGNSRIEPSEIVEVSARIHNTGGPARRVTAAVRLGDNVFLTADSKRTFDLGEVKPNQIREVTFSLYTNNRATAAPVDLIIEEDRREYGKILSIPLAFNTPQKKITELVVIGREEVAAPDNTPALTIDVDVNIPGTNRRNPNAIAVILGIERYQRMAGVSFAKRDAAIFREYAVNVLGISSDNNHLSYSVDDAVTRGEFEKLFTSGGWLEKRVTAQTDVFIFYAGHGAPDIVTDRPYLIPHDGDANYPTQTGFSLDRLYEGLAPLPARSVTVFLDACFSGRTREDQALLAGRAILPRARMPELSMKQMLVFAAAAGGQMSSAYPEKQHGLFTYFLLKGLRGDANANNNRELTAQELQSYLLANVSQTAGLLDREQTPQLLGQNTDRILVRY